VNAVAIQHYQEALKVCAKEKLQQELKKDIAGIYYGLAEAYRLIGDFERAHTHGRMALQMYEELSERYFVCRVYNVLGRIAFQLGDHQTAAELYMESLSLAVLEDRAGMKMLNFIGMAEVRLAENRLDEAHRYCDHALETSAHLQDDHHLCGLMYLVRGKVAFARAKEMQGEEIRYGLQEAQKIYEKAEEQLAQTQATMLRSELYGRRAEVYEALNQPQEALACWKQAFDTTAVPRGVGWYE
jgi:tetratricopeptide (TPR) repeat protein